MATPTRYFLDAAARYGNVDRGDLEAVQHWFIEVLPTLPPVTVNEIFDELLENVGSSADDDTEPVYPKDVPLPLLSASPPAPTPVFAVHVGALLIKLIGRNKN